jgi:hypothetical protein
MKHLFSTALIIGSLPVGHLAYADSLAPNYLTLTANPGGSSPISTYNGPVLATAMANGSSSQNGTDTQGNQYTSSGLAHSDIDGLALYASASLSGSVSPDALNSQSIASTQVDFAFLPGSYYIEDSLTADGNGIDTSGGGTGSGYFRVNVDSNNGVLGDCSISLDGGYQTCSTGLVPVSSSNGNWLTAIAFQASITASAPLNSSATVDYWGTFTAAPLQVYDQNMNLIQTIDWSTLGTSPVPEPSTLLLLATGCLGLVGRKYVKRVTAV